MPALSLARFAVTASLAVAVAAAAPALPAYADDTTGTVAGHFLNGTDPVTDIPVVLQMTDGSAEVATATTDASGAFSFADVAPGDYAVRFDLPGGARQFFHHSRSAREGQVVSVTAGAEATVEETLAPYGSVTGRLLAASGEPLVGATVTADDESGAPPLTATTDANGEYSLSYVWPSAYLVTFTVPGSDLKQYVPGAANRDEASTVAVAAGPPTVVNDTRLATGTVTGSVARFSGVAKGTVYAFRPGSGTALTSVAIKADGTFSLETFAGPVQLMFAVPAGKTTTSQWYQQQPYQATAEILDLSPGGALSIADNVVDWGNLTGFLRDPDGNPVAGANVYATSGSRTLSTTTNENGKYGFRLPTGSYKVRFEAQGAVQWATGKYSADQANSFSVGVNQAITVNDVWLPSRPPPPTSGLTGKLTDNGAGVGSVQVSVYTENQDWVGSTVTNGLGAFAFPDLSSGTYKVKFTLPGYLDQWSSQKWDFESADIITVNDGAATTLNEEAAPHGQITGRLTSADGNAVVWAPVTATSTDGRIIAYADTDAYGRYTFAWLPTGGYKIAFMPFGWGGLTQFAHQKSRAEDADVIAVDAGATVTVDEEVMRFATVTGQLTDQGQPVPYTQVYIYEATHGDITYAYTDGGGNWSAQVHPGRYKVNFVLTNGLSQWAHQARDEAAATVFTFGTGENVVNEELLPTASIRGRLLDHNGEPVTSGNVEISDGTEFFNAYLGENGEWSATVVPGTYKVRFITDTANQWAYGKTTAQAADAVTVAAGATVVVDDQLLAPGSLKVTATDAATGAAISTFCAYADNGITTDACTTTGTVTLTGLSGGEYTVATYVEEETSDYLMTETRGVVVTTGQETVVAAKLRKGATISTIVKDAATGAPVPGACVELVEVGRPSWLGASRKVCADDQGVVTQNRITPNAYKLFVWVTDGVHGRQWVGPNGGVGAQATAKTVTLSSGQTTTVAAIKLDKAGSVSGIITDKATGAPIANAIAALSSYNDGHGGGGGAPGALVATDAQGRYTLTDLGPYDWTLFFRHRGYAAQWSGDVPNRLLADGVKVKVNTTTRYDVKLRKGTALTGKVLGSDGQPVDVARVTVINAVTGDEMGSGDTAPDGTYTVPVFGPQLIKIRIGARSAASGAPSSTRTRTP
ncbi:carboxypeptidase regulatory-like domain-containing protein [Luedemannella flava]